MSVRQLSALKEIGFTESHVDFRRILTEVKDAHYPDCRDEELSDSRDEADAYCAEVRHRFGVQPLPRTFILRRLVGVRKHRVKA